MDNIIQLFAGQTDTDDELFRSTLGEFVAHLEDGSDFEETCRKYISIAAIAWADRVGYVKLRENLFGLIAAMDKKHGHE